MAMGCVTLSKGPLWGVYIRVYFKGFCP